MNMENRKFDNEQKPVLSDRFTEDMRKLYSASVSVPPEIDRAILDKASQKLTRPRRRLHILRWIGPAAAAAAIIIFAFVFTNQSTPADIDRNGKVDILDAFKLAKHIQSESKPNIKWDINGDGFVNQQDVDSVALAAVSLNKGA